MGLITISCQEGHGKCDRVCDMWMETNANAKQNSKRDNVESQERKTTRRGSQLSNVTEKSEGPELPKINLSNSHRREKQRHLSPNIH